jgi:TfoX/Sxy family transcriptional regulator of competence genes
MAFDEGLSERLHDQFEQLGLAPPNDLVAKRMFGGLCFMVRGHMCCGIVGDTLMARVGPDQYAECLEASHAREMDFTGRAMKGMVYVSPEGIDADEDLATWVDSCLSFLTGLPPKVKGLVPPHDGG